MNQVALVKRKSRREGPVRPSSWSELFGPELFGPQYAAAAARLDAEQAAGRMGDVDQARILGAARGAAGRPDELAAVMKEIEMTGAAAFVHPSGQRDLPIRYGQHDLIRGRVRLGRVTGEPRNPERLQGRAFALDLVTLSGTLLACGPVGSGLTGLALPVAEHLCLQALANQASVVVIAPGGDGFAPPGFFDVDIDLANPAGTWGFDLYGGAVSAEDAASRLASAVLPPGPGVNSGANSSADAGHVTDAARNALHLALARFHAAYGAYPKVRQLLGMLRGDERLLQPVRDRLRAQGLLAAYEDPLTTGEYRRGRQDDPAALLVERVGLLNRPTLVSLLDEKQRTFSMRDIGQPTRVRIALPEGVFPEAARMLGRLAVAQFLQVCSAPQADPDIFRVLVVGDADRYVDARAASSLRQIRYRRAGLVLLTESMSEFSPDVLPVLSSSARGKMLFAGISPREAQYFADFWGTRWVDEVTFSSGVQRGVSVTEGHDTVSRGRGGSRTRQPDVPSRSSSLSTGISARPVERPLWSPSEIANDIPPSHALVSLTKADDSRIPPVLVNLRG